jgi:hypothetical protein
MANDQQTTRSYYVVIVPYANARSPGAMGEPCAAKDAERFVVLDYSWRSDEGWVLGQYSTLADAQKHAKLFSEGQTEGHFLEGDAYLKLVNGPGLRNDSRENVPGGQSGGRYSSLTPSPENQPRRSSLLPPPGWSAAEHGRDNGQDKGNEKDQGLSM